MFDLNQVKKLTTAKQVEDYCYETLGKPSGYGSSRITFTIDQSSVIKVYRHEPPKQRKLNQNEREFERSLCLGPEIAVEVLDYDIHGFKWLIEEKLITLRSHEWVKEINKILGTNYSHYQYMDIVDMFIGFGFQKESEQFEQTNQWYSRFITAIKNCNTGRDDLTASNFGIRPSTGELILLDLGFI